MDPLAFDAFTRRIAGSRHEALAALVLGAASIFAGITEADARNWGHLDHRLLQLTVAMLSLAQAMAKGLVMGPAGSYEDVVTRTSSTLVLFAVDSGQRAVELFAIVWRKP